ncbi:hypothetical protein ACS0TY_035449 [Phlomoides rotata]
MTKLTPNFIYLVLLPAFVFDLPDRAPKFRRFSPKILELPRRSGGSVHHPATTTGNIAVVLDLESRYGEQVAIFLSVLSHHSKVRVVKFCFRRSSHTVHQHFHNILRAVLNLHGSLLASPTPVDDECTQPRWKHFKGCLCALDGTLIDVTVPEIDKARYRIRKGTISVNVLVACDRSMRFIYILTGWEGSAADARVLRDAVCRNDGFNVPHGRLNTFYIV